MKFLLVAGFAAAVASAFQVKYAHDFTWETSWKEEYIPDWSNVDHKAAWEGWKQEFGKTYASIEEEAERFLVFLENWRFINDFNSKDENTYSLRMNQFGDLRIGDEFKQHVHGHTGSCIKRKTASEIANTKRVNPSLLGKPMGATVDWRTKGVVTPVKNQGSCGSCWAFSTTGSTESRYAIATGQLTSLSEQELVDCSGSYGNDGCDGGLMDYAFEYIQAKGGLCSEDEYPYKGVDGTCQSCSTRYDDISGHKDVTSDDESALASAVNDGPVSIAIEADQSSFQFYSGGVLTGRCGTSLDHGVLIVGYGTEGSQEYWIVKNSWGTSWGEDGYVYICKDCNKNGSEGECGINMEPSYPIAKS